MVEIRVTSHSYAIDRCCVDKSAAEGSEANALDPVCGMALEREESSLDDAPNPGLVKFTRRFWISAALLVLSTGSDLCGPLLLCMFAGAVIAPSSFTVVLN